MALELVVVTPEGEALSETVEQVVLPGEAGEFGVLESHERFLTPLKQGPMHIIRAQAGSSDKEWAAVSSGFADVGGSRVVVLVDHCVLASDIDHAEAERRRSEAATALAQLERSEGTAFEIARLEAVVSRAELHLHVKSL